MQTALSELITSTSTQEVSERGSVKVFKFPDVQFKNSSGTIVNGFKDVTAVLLLTTSCTLRLTGTSFSNGFKTNPGNYITLKLGAFDSSSVELQAFEFMLFIPCNELPLEVNAAFDPGWFDNTVTMRIPPAHQLHTTC